MDIKITKIHNTGNSSEEYVMMKVLEDCKLSDYAIYDTTYSSGMKSDKLRHFYRFGSVNVKEGEIVLLRTKSGNYRKYTHTSGRIIHEFFWGIRSSVWNDEEDAAVLIKIAEMKKMRVS